MTEELAMVRLTIAEENSDREKIVRDLEKELQEVKGEPYSMNLYPSYIIRFLVVFTDLTE